MSVKDFDVSENIDREKNQKSGEDWKSHQGAAGEKSKDKEPPAKTEVKNAHATGDGSYGRSDESISETDDKENMSDNIY